MLSIGQLCEDKFKGIFNKCQLHVLKNANIFLRKNGSKLNGSFENTGLILQGHRNKNNGLWNMNIDAKDAKSTQNNNLQLNAIICKNTSKSNLPDYLYACAFSQTLPTFYQAIKNQNFVTWPAIDMLNFN